MYISLSYAPTNPSDDALDPSILDIAVDHAIESVGYVNAWHPIPGTRVVLANVPHNGPDGATLHYALQTELRTLPIVFVATRSDTGWEIARSTPAPPKSKTDATSDY